MRKLKTLKHFRLILSTAVALIVIGLLILTGRFPFLGKKELPKTTTVKKGALLQTVSASGEVKAQNQVTLKFQTSGKLAWVGVKEGDEVKAWQAIASLDKRELERELLKALRDYSKERWDFEEARQVTYKDQIITDTIKRILEKNQFDLDKAVADVEIADIALKLATIVTPISGIVTEIESPVAGVNITPATAEFTIADPSVMKFVANVDESDIGGVRIGQKAIISLDAYPEEEFEGEITKIAFASITTRGGGTAFPVEITLPENKNLRFKVGMNGDAEIIIQEEENTLFIPASSVWKRKDKHYVWLIKEGKAVKQEVKIGLETDDAVEVIEGLVEKDEVISEGVSKIKEGQKVR